MERRLIELPPTIAKINVVPIIDVALVLVIILLITAPMVATTDLEINLPGARTRSIEDEARVSITLGTTGELGIDDQYVDAREFVGQLRRRLESVEKKDVLVVVRADETAPYPAVKAIIKDVRRAGARRIAIATRQNGKVGL